MTVYLSSKYLKKKKGQAPILSMQKRYIGCLFVELPIFGEGQTSLKQNRMAFVTKALLKVNHANI